jgi:hypothetical protein
MQDLGLQVYVNIDGGLQHCAIIWYFAVSASGCNEVPPLFELNMEAP